MINTCTPIYMMGNLLKSYSYNTGTLNCKVCSSIVVLKISMQESLKPSYKSDTYDLISILTYTHEGYFLKTCNSIKNTVL